MQYHLVTIVRCSLVVIEFINVKIYPNEVLALNSINVKINKVICILVGQSGSESTFLKLIIKEEDPTEGTIL